MQVIKTIKTLNVRPSCNFISKFRDSVIESRYVRKADEYIACYVSSHNGCKMGCKMCHLTAEKDLKMDHVSIPAYLQQIETVLKHYKEQPGPFASRCNINFMAKGDVMANRYVVNQYPELYQGMEKLCNSYNLKVKPNISSIMPFTIKHKSLKDIFQGYPAFIYYSLYSIHSEFRKKWLPNAIPWQDALKKIKEFQETDPLKQIATFHWCFIKGENDHVQQVKELAKVLKEYQFNGKLNIVRFNPHPSLSLSYQETEIEKIQDLFSLLNESFQNHEKSYIVPRLDCDTKIACGLFYPLNAIDSIKDCN